MTCTRSRARGPLISKLNEGHAPRRQRARAAGRRHGRGRGARDRRGPGTRCAGDQGQRRPARPERSAPRGRADSDRHRRRARRPSTCSATTPPTSSPRPCSSSIPAPRSRSARRSSDGFYYDFDFPDGVKISDADFERIEAKMREHVKADEPFERSDVPVDDAIERFEGEGQDYKVELIDDLVRDEGVETVSLYRNGPFTDLCRGPHGPGTGRIKAFKLMSVAGAYWRGDSNRPMLTRIYGTAFFSKDDLRGPPRPARAGPRPRPPQARQGARAVHVLGPRARHAVLAADGHARLERAHRPLAARERRPRLHRGAHADPLRRRPLEAVRPLGQVPGQHVLHRGRGASRWASSP